MLNQIWNKITELLKIILIKGFRLTFLESRWDALMQFFKFGIVGLSNTIISYVVYLIGVFFGLHYLLASILGFVISILNSFYWNNQYVFKTNANEKRSLISSFCKTFLAYAGTGLVLNNILLIIQVDILHCNKTIAPLINLIITIPLNFVLNKFWAFKTKKDEE